MKIRALAPIDPPPKLRRQVLQFVHYDEGWNVVKVETWAKPWGPWSGLTSMTLDQIDKEWE